MITSSDAALVLYKDCKTYFGIDTYLPDNVPSGELTEERIVVRAKPQTAENIWIKGYVEVNLCVPDKKNESDSIRLQELEREAFAYFHNGIAGIFDGTPYLYSSSSIGIEADTTLRCHYVNVRVMFQVLNV